MSGSGGDGGIRNPDKCVTGTRDNHFTTPPSDATYTESPTANYRMNTEPFTSDYSSPTVDANPLFSQKRRQRKGNQLYLRSSRTILPRTRPFSLPFAQRRARRFSNINLRISLNIGVYLSFVSYIYIITYISENSKFFIVAGEEVFETP